MLPAPARMRAKADFHDAVRRGRRCGCSYLVLHLLLAEPGGNPMADPGKRISGEGTRGHPQVGGAAADDAVTPRTLSITSPEITPRIGFVVSRQVGGAVTRNHVERRLRHAARDVVPVLPGGSRLVVRALPSAAQASFGELHDDLRRGVRRCLSRMSGQDHPRSGDPRRLGPEEGDR